MNQDKLTIKTQEVLQNAQELATELNNQSIEIGHILSSIVQTDKDVYPFLLKKANINSSIIEKVIEREIKNYPKVTGGQMYLSNETNEVINKAFELMKELVVS